MKIIALSFSFLWISCLALAQVAGQPVVELLYRKVISTPLHLDKPIFGGLSGIELFNKDQLNTGLTNLGLQISTDSLKMGKEQFLVVADHYPDSGPGQQSYAFVLNANSGIEKAFEFNKKTINGIESIRWNDHFKRLFYCYETDTETGVAFVDQSGEKKLFQTPIVSDNTSDNRGIEGITFGSDNKLWFAFESGGRTTRVKDSLLFIRKEIKLENPTAGREERFYYDFDRFANIELSLDPFDGSNGNGVSEILTLPGKKDSLLVLERSYDKKNRKGYAMLYLATVKPGLKKLKKELVASINDLLPAEIVNGRVTNAHEQPGNIEGMTWGIPENGNLILYLISDDNYNPGRLKTKLFKLQIKNLH